MRAKKVNENINFERGRDPKDAMGIGIRNITQLGPLSKRPTHVLRRQGQEVQTSRGYKLWKLLKFIESKNLKGESVGYRDSVKYYYHDFKGEPHRRSFSRGVWESLQWYIDRVGNHKYILNLSGKRYLERYGFFDDDIESIKEGLDFKRGQDPKKSLRIGKNRYKDFGDYVEQELSKHGLDSNDFWSNWYDEISESVSSEDMAESALEILRNTPIEYQINWIEFDVASFIENKNE